VQFVRSKQHKACLNLAIVALSFCACPAAQSREQWQMQHPDGPAPTGPVTTSSYGSSAIVDPNKPGAPSSFAPGLVAAPGANFGNGTPSMAAPGLSLPGTTNQRNSNGRMPPPEIIQQIISSRLPVGTVLTGVVADDLSTKSSRANDLFSVVLADGYYRNGVEVIPVNSRIIGTVVGVTSPHMTRGVGAPGQLEVALTTLVFPDGRSIKVNAFMDRNPAHDLLNAPKVRTNSFDFGDYKRGVSSMLGSFTSGIGAVQRIRNRGPEFSLKAGTLVPVRLNSTIDLTLMSPPTVATGAPAAGSPATTSGIGNLSPLNPPQGTFGMPGGVSSLPGSGPILPVDLPDPF